MDTCLDGFPADAEIVDSAESEGFRRGDALAWSLAWVLSSSISAVTAHDALVDPRFLECFVQTVTGDVAPEAVVELTGPSRAVIGAGRATIVVDLVVLQAGPVVAMAVLADSPRPFPPRDLDHVAERLARRLV